MFVLETIVFCLLATLTLGESRQLTGLQIGDATLNITTTSTKTLLVSMRNWECEKCKLTQIAQVNAANGAQVTMASAYPYYYLFIQNRVDQTLYCQDLLEKAIYFGENGVYKLNIVFNISDENDLTCQLTTITPPDQIYQPLYVAVAILIGVGLMYVFSKCFYVRVVKPRFMNQLDNNSHVINTDLGVPILAGSSTYVLDEHKPAPSKKANRMKCVDVFRGICLGVMIFANYGSGGYSLLDHTPWNGLHLADTLFPSFIFIMGISVPFAFRSLASRAANASRNDPNSSVKIGSILYKIFKRTFLLFFFGLVISNESSKHLTHLRIMGVLQRFAVTYFVVAFLELLYFRMNNYSYPDPNELLIESSSTSMPTRWTQIKLKFIEVFYFPLQWVIVFLLGLIWTLLTFLLPVEGCPTGYIGPGGLHDNASYFNCTGGSAAYLDRVIMGVNHVYQNPTCKQIYQNTLAHDPEGLLGCLTSCVLAYLGLSAGHIIIFYKDASTRIKKFLMYSVLYFAIALILCKCSKNDGWIPLNKNLWSLSYVILIAGMAFFLLTVLYLLVDIYDIYSGTPFLYLGRNSITIYICHEIFVNFFPFFEVDYTHAWLLFIDIYGISLWLIVASIMNYKKTFISL